MTREERKPTGLLHSADELKQLIVENPDLPILVFATIPKRTKSPFLSIFLRKYNYGYGMQMRW